MMKHVDHKKVPLLNLMLLLFSIIASLGILEIGIRIFAPQCNPGRNIYFISLKDETPLAPHNFSGRHYSKGDYDVSVNINKYGFRDKKDIGNSGGKNIFVVGDSFSFGYGVEEEKRYSNVLEDLIKIPVYNIGTTGNFDSYQRLIDYAKINGATIHNLIIGVCMENDLIFYEHRNSKDDKALYRDIGLPWFRRIKDVLLMKSAAYRFLTRIVDQNEALGRFAINLKLKEDSYGAIQKHHFDQGLIDQSADRLSNIAKQYNTIILVIPSRMLYYDGNEEELKVHMGFVSLLKDIGLKVVDMHEYLKDSEPLSFYFKHDGHWNDKAHELAARVLNERIKMAQFFEIRRL